MCFDQMSHMWGAHLRNAEFQEDEKAESIEITLSAGLCGDLPWPADCRDPIIPFLIEQMILAC